MMMMMMMMMMIVMMMMMIVIVIMRILCYEYLRFKPFHDKGMHGRQASDERLYFNVEEGGRGPKSMEDVQEDTKVRVACYMASQNRPLDQSSIRY